MASKYDDIDKLVGTKFNKHTILGFYRSPAGIMSVQYRCSCGRIVKTQWRKMPVCCKHKYKKKGIKNDE